MPSPSPNAFNIYESNYYMFQKRHYDYDVVIQVKAKEEEKKEGYKFHAHSFILKSRCPGILEANGEKDSKGSYTCEIDYVEESHLLELMRFLYCDEANLTLENVFSVLKLARHYQQRTMIDYCKKYVIDNIRVKTVCRILESSLANREGHLRDESLKFIGENAKKVLGDRSFLYCNEDTLDAITSLDKINMGEMELFKHVLVWAKFDPDTGRNRPQEPKGDDLKEILGKVLTNRRIRFPLMTTEEFTKWVIPLAILEEKDKVEIGKYIHGPQDNRPYTSFNCAKRRPVQLQA